MANDVAAMNDDDRTKLIGEIVSALSDCMDDGGLVVPAECHTVTAQKEGSRESPLRVRVGHSEHLPGTSAVEG